MSENKSLIWIFNADSGAINSMKDFFKKIVKPNEYECNLCSVTFGALGMDREWKQYVSELPIDSNFLHRDEFEDLYDVKNAKYPSTYLRQNSEMRLFISHEEMNSMKSVEELENLVDKKLKEFNI